jgi:hypothetical protein
MAQPTPISFNQFLIKLGDGASPEVFTQAPLAMNSRGFNQTLKTSDYTIPDSANEDLPVPETSVGDSITREMTGKGTIQAADVATWDAKFRAGVAFNVEMTISGTIYYKGPVLLTAFNLTGERTKTVDCDITLKAAGDMTLTTS